jgi:hypothetical protein
MDAKHLVLPDEDYMRCEEGLPENHHYRDLRGMEKGDVDFMEAEAKVILDYDGDPESDEAWEELCDNEVYRLDLDPEIAPAVAAVSAAGAVPFTSCSGGPGHYETHPLVGCWCTPEVFAKIEKAAFTAEVNLDGLNPGVLIWHESDPGAMSLFANELARLL